MKMISRLFVLALLMSLTACAAHKKQIVAQSVSTDTKVAPVVAESKIETPEKPVVVAPKPTVYIVKPNETLERISKSPAVYGDRKMWPVLFEANRDKLSHPSKIYPGQRLRIPRDAEEIALLKKRASTNKVILTADQAYREGQAAKQKALAAKSSALSTTPVPAAPPSAPTASQAVSVATPPSIPEAPEAVEIIPTPVSLAPSGVAAVPVAPKEAGEEKEEAEEEASPF